MLPGEAAVEARVVVKPVLPKRIGHHVRSSEFNGMVIGIGGAQSRLLFFAFLWRGWLPLL